MSSIILDTHALIWASTNDLRLSLPARAAIKNAGQSKRPAYVPTIAVVELRYLVEKKTIVEGEFRNIISILRNPASVITIVPLDLDIAEELINIPRATVPDMPDRIIAATALAFGLPLVTADHKIRALTNITTIW